MERDETEPQGGRPGRRDVGHVETEEPELPELTKLRDFDRKMHLQKSLEAGLPREQAERHADEELETRDDSRR